MKVKKKTLLIAISIFAVFAAICCYYYIQHVKKHNAWLTIYGNVDIREVNLSFRIPGLIKTMAVEEGDAVRNGQIIANLDKDQYVDQLNEANALVNTNNAKLNELLAGTRPEEIAQARARVHEQEAALINAKLLFEKNKKGYPAGVVSKQDYDNSKKQMEASMAQLASAQSALLEAVNGPRKEDIQAARANLQAAIANASHLEKTISYTILPSPADGFILTRIKEPGAYVAAGEPIYTLAINSPKWVQAYVDETKLGKLKPGMPVQIKTDSYPDKTYLGTIGFISPTAEFTPKSVETPELRSSLVYRIRIVAQDFQNQLRQGMPVTVKINVGSAKNAKIVNKNK